MENLLVAAIVALVLFSVLSTRRAYHLGCIRGYWDRAREEARGAEAPNIHYPDKSA